MLKFLLLLLTCCSSFLIAQNDSLEDKLQKYVIEYNVLYKKYKELKQSNISTNGSKLKMHQATDSERYLNEAINQLNMALLEEPRRLDILQLKIKTLRDVERWTDLQNAVRYLVELQKLLNGKWRDNRGNVMIWIENDYFYYLDKYIENISNYKNPRAEIETQILANFLMENLPNYSTSYIQAAHTEIKNNAYTEAIKILEKANTLIPNNVKIINELANAYSYNKDKINAKKYSDLIIALEKEFKEKPKS